MANPRTIPATPNDPRCPYCCAPLQGRPFGGVMDCTKIIPTIFTHCGGYSIWRAEETKWQVYPLCEGPASNRLG